MLIVLHCRLAFLDRIEIFDAEHVCVFGRASMFGRLRNHVDDLRVSPGRMWTECRLKLDVSSRYYSFYRIHGGVIAFLFGTLYHYLDMVCLRRRHRHGNINVKITFAVGANIDHPCSRGHKGGGLPNRKLIQALARLRRVVLIDEYYTTKLLDLTVIDSAIVMRS